MAISNPTSIDQVIAAINWTRIESNIERIPFGGCWIYTGYLSGSGYPVFEHQQRPYRVHRLMYHRHFGNLRNDLFVCHRCDNPACVNPDHLFLGTQAENLRDMDAKGRRVVTAIEKRRPKLSPIDVRFIRESGRGDRELARMFGIGHKSIAKIRHGKTWRHV